MAAAVADAAQSGQCASTIGCSGAAGHGSDDMVIRAANYGRI
jgi:hypothetical protein